jgi:hypothetical protein
MEREETDTPATQARRSRVSSSAAVGPLGLLVVGLGLTLPIRTAAQTIPSPESVLGHTVGEDFYLATYEESIEYFQRRTSIRRIP